MRWIKKFQFRVPLIKPKHRDITMTYITDPELNTLEFHISLLVTRPRTAQLPANSLYNVSKMCFRPIIEKTNSFLLLQNLSSYVLWEHQLNLQELHANLVLPLPAQWFLMDVLERGFQTYLSLFEQNFKRLTKKLERGEPSSCIKGGFVLRQSVE